MKKLLVLVLVLVLTSLANAVIYSPMEIDTSDSGATYYINMSSGMSYAVDGPSGGYWLLVGVDSDSGALATTLPATMDMSTIDGDGSWLELGDGVYGGFVASSTSTTWTAASGIYADSFTALEGATALYLYQLDDDYENPVLVDTYDIPEPATIALLCLGGLLLRKK